MKQVYLLHMIYKEDGEEKARTSICCSSEKMAEALCHSLLNCAVDEKAHDNFEFVGGYVSFIESAEDGASWLANGIESSMQAKNKSDSNGKSD